MNHQSILYNPIVYLPKTNTMAASDESPITAHLVKDLDVILMLDSVVFVASLPTTTILKDEKLTGNVNILFVHAVMEDK